MSRHLAGPPSSVWDISQLQHSNVYRSGNPPNRGDDAIGVGRLQEVVNDPEKNRQNSQLDSSCCGVAVLPEGKKQWAMR